MDRDADTTFTCPTCGFPVRVFPLATPEMRCPHCRVAWERVTSTRGDHAKKPPGEKRSIDDLL
jgi:hypothetical protein